MNKGSDQISRQTVLIIDDDQVFRTRLGRALESRGYTVRLAADGGQALEIARRVPAELAILDLRMPGEGGLEVLRALRALSSKMRIVVLTGYGSIATAIEAMRLGATYYLTKPADADELLAAFDGGRTSRSSVAAVFESAPSLARAEWEHIHRVLTDCNGNISKAARLLGIHRRTLQRKLDKFAPKR